MVQLWYFSMDPRLGWLYLEVFWRLRNYFFSELYTGLFVLWEGGYGTGGRRCAGEVSLARNSLAQRNMAGVLYCDWTMVQAC